ncbi:DUF2274 domain-containing protein [Agrobacterium sp. S2]|nr:DUF2274 domain-containing protein [Agrobacterium sp. S2]
MAKLKLGLLADDKPVKVAVELPAQFHGDLIDYGALLADSGAPSGPARLIVPLPKRLIAKDRGFAKARKQVNPSSNAT